MAKTTMIQIACVVLGLAITVAARAEESWVDSKSKNVERFLQETFAQGNAGMVIGLLDEQGRKVFGAGKLDNGTDRGVDGETVFEIGSVTKVFTVLLLLDSVRRGEMNLDDPLAKHLPADVRVPSRNGKEITLLNLAVQDSGLPLFPPEKNGDEKHTDGYPLDNLYSSISAFQLPQDPGAKFEYSNVGMAVLGNAIERATDSNFESLVLERICRPLKMNDTRITLPAEMQSRLATGHLADGSQAEHWRLGSMAPAGALHSTANDLLIFVAAHLGTTATELTPLMQKMQVVHHMDAPMFGKTAMPWMDERVYQPAGSELWGHAGGVNGVVAFVAFDRKKRRGVVVLTNQLKVHPNGIGWKLLQGMPLTRDNVPLREVVGVGIGLESEEKTGLPRITSVFPKSPAGQAGLTAGLLIRQINGVSLQGKTLADCVTLLGGPVDSKVRLELEDTQQVEKTIELTRQRFLTIRDETPLEQ